MTENTDTANPIQPVATRRPGFEVFFDGDCPACRREMDMVQRKDRDKLLILTDISDSRFDASAYDNKRLDEFMRVIHGRDESGTWFTEVDVFREIYSRIGFRKLVGISRWPVVRHLLYPGYRVFAFFRYRLAVRRMNAANCGDQCRSGQDRGNAIGTGDSSGDANAVADDGLPSRDQDPLTQSGSQIR